MSSEKYKEYSIRYTAEGNVTAWANSAEEAALSAYFDILNTNMNEMFIRWKGQPERKIDVGVIREILRNEICGESASCPTPQKECKDCLIEYLKESGTDGL